MDAYALHLAVAALVGSSVVAVSAYYMHRKTLTQLLEFAKSVDNNNRDNKDDNDDDVSDHYHDSPHHLMRKKKRGSGGNRIIKGNGYYRRVSASLPDVTAISGDSGPLHVDGIPAGLPKLHTLHEGMYIWPFCEDFFARVDD